MYAIDLFEADAQSGYVPVNPERPGTRHRKLGNLNLDAIKASFAEGGTPKPATLHFLNGTSRTLTSAEVDAVADYYDSLKTKVEKANFIYRTFISQDKMANLLFKFKQLNLDLQPPREPDAGPEQLTLFQEKKSFDKPKYKDVGVQRAVRQAQADFPTAASDDEAFIKSMMVQQDQDQKNIDRLKTGLNRQKELLNKNSELDSTQDQTIDNLNKEIHNVEKDNDNLQLSLQQMQRANAELQQTLDRMRGKRTEPEPQLGVSVATDKQPAVTIQQQPATVPTNVATRQDLAKIAQRQRQQRLAGKPTKQLSQPSQSSLGTGQIDGQDADIYASLKNTGVPGSFRKVVTDIPVKMKAEDLTHGLEEGEVIPTKQVLQGYVVEFNPRAKVVTISQRGQLLKQYKMATPSRRAYDQTVNKFIHSQEDDKYPMDIDDRDVRLPMKKVAEALPAKAAKELYRWKNQQAQQATTPAPLVPVAEPQPVPARLSDLQARHQRVEALADIKGEIEAMQQKATKGGRILPRGLAADLEDYYTLADIDQYYDEIMAKYQKQKAALAQYTGMKKILNKKVTHEMRAHDLEETKTSKAYDDGGREGYYGRPNRNPYEPGTQEHRDYNAGYKHFKDDKDYGAPRRPVKENEISVSGQPIKQEKGYYAIYIKRGDRWSPLTKYPDRTEAEEIKRGLEKRGEEVIIREGGWKKETPWIKSTGKDPRGEVTHMSDVARKETERREREDSPMGQLFKDFEKVFGKKPPVKEGNVVNINRGGYNQFRDKNDFLDKRDYIQKQLLDPSQRENYNELKQRLQDINYAGRKLGYIK